MPQMYTDPEMQAKYERRCENMLKIRKLRTYTKGTVSHTRRRLPPPIITRSKLLRALRGSGGIKTVIAKRLSAYWWQVRAKMLLPGWEECLEVFKLEQERIVDESEKTVLFMVKQRDDYNCALQAAKLVLQCKGIDRGWRREITIQGGENPLRVQSAVVNIDALQLPLEIRKSLLEAVEASGNTEKVLELDAQLLPIKPKIRVGRVVDVDESSSI